MSQGDILVTRNIKKQMSFRIVKVKEIGHIANGASNDPNKLIQTEWRIHTSSAYNLNIIGS